MALDDSDANKDSVTANGVVQFASSYKPEKMTIKGSVDDGNGEKRVNSKGAVVDNTALNQQNNFSGKWNIGKYLDFSETTQSKQIQIGLKLKNGYNLV